MDFYDKTREREEREERECLNRMKRALNTRMHDNIFPHWQRHSTLKGWSTINYPGTLSGQRRFRTPHKEGSEAASAYQTLSPPIRKRRPISNEIELKAARIEADPAFSEAFFNKIGKQQEKTIRKNYYDIIRENKRFKVASRTSGATISTDTYEDKKKLLEKLNSKAEATSVLKPIACILGPKVDPLNSRKVKKLNEPDFKNEESDEDEDTYKFKVCFHVVVEIAEIVCNAINAEELFERRIAENESRKTHLDQRQFH
eukprot:TRINITY_DN11242_c0_g1_i9.p2 TRINITY_DN11242_c0_g1~~TRINITY_DN11242_c0_g1_i9.p2  ORF type:complete len:258 (-),score=38.84 TRINITY_DN11242_c0_g1_i9:1069-1842(-)